MNHSKFLLPPLLIAGWLGIISSSFASESLPSHPGRLAAKNSRDHVVDVKPGTYVRGEFAGTGMHLALLDAMGRTVRTLAQGRRDVEEFMFVVGQNGPYRLAIHAPKGGEYRLAITQRIPPSAQMRPKALPESPLLRTLQATRGNTDAFWREVERIGAPLIETEGVLPPLAANERLVTFLWRGAERGVQLFGAPSADHDELAHLPGTDIWYRSYRLPDSTRLAYRLAPDVPELDAPPHIRRRAILATAQRDPFNTKSIPDSPVDQFDGYSLLELSSAPTPQWNKTLPGVANGTLETRRLASHILGNAREIHLYRPFGWVPGRAENALLVLFDGETYTREIPTQTILDNLFAHKRIPSTAAIFITNPSGDARGKELPPNQAFARFLAEELMPWARAHGIFASATRTVIAGASYGGLAATWAGYSHPELFGNVYSQSGSFWWSPDWETSDIYTRPTEWLTQVFAQRERLPLRFHLEAGLFELGRDGQAGIRDTTRHLRDVLKAKGYAVSHREYAAGHGYEHWQVSLAEGLISLIGTERAFGAEAQ